MTPMENDENQPWSSGRKVQAAGDPVASLPANWPQHERCTDWKSGISLPDLLFPGQTWNTLEFAVIT